MGIWDAGHKASEPQCPHLLHGGGISTHSASEVGSEGAALCHVILMALLLWCGHILGLFWIEQYEMLRKCDFRSRIWPREFPQIQTSKEFPGGVVVKDHSCSIVTPVAWVQSLTWELPTHPGHSYQKKKKKDFQSNMEGYFKHSA